jgi:exonuclease III
MVKLLSLNTNLRFPKRLFLKNPSKVKRIDVLTSCVLDCRPDFLCFQEVTDLLLVWQMQKSFLAYNPCFHFRFWVLGGLLTFYNKQRFKLLEKKFYAFWDQGKFFSKQLSDRILKKGILLTSFKDKKTGKTIVLINLHLTANYGQKLKDEERVLLKIQLKQIKRLVEKRKKKTDLQIIAGDFNASFASKTIKNWVKGLGLKTAFKPNVCTICPEKNPFCNRDQKKDYQIDNVLYKKGKLKKAKLLFNKKGEFISDHFGMLVKIVF